MSELKMESKRLYVRWIDSGFSIRSDVWQTLDDIEELLQESKEVETVGFLVTENEDWIVLAQSVSLDLLRGGYFIYKKNIVEQKEI